MTRRWCGVRAAFRTGSNETLSASTVRQKWMGDARSEINTIRAILSFRSFVRWTHCTETNAHRLKISLAAAIVTIGRMLQYVWKQSQSDSDRFPSDTLSFVEIAANSYLFIPSRYRDVCSIACGIVSSLVFKIRCSLDRAAKVKVNTTNNSGDDDDDALSVGAIRCQVWRCRSQTSE